MKLHQHETFQHLQQVLADRLINTFALICVVGLPAYCLKFDYSYCCYMQKTNQSNTSHYSGRRHFNDHVVFWRCYVWFAKRDR